MKATTAFLALWSTFLAATQALNLVERATPAVLSFPMQKRAVSGQGLQKRVISQMQVNSSSPAVAVTGEREVSFDMSLHLGSKLDKLLTG
jgi:hypothetical protein